MKIQYLSDLHLEGGIASWLKNFKPSGEVLVLVGDIVTPRCRFRLEECFDHLGVPVVYVPGNHEYYRSVWPDDDYQKEPPSFSETKEHYKQFCDGLSNITLLNPGVKVIGNVAFIGATLWSSPDLLYETDIARGIADFHAIKNWSIDSMRSVHYFEKEFIKHSVEEQRKLGRKTVVVTHFAPSFKAQDPMFEGSALSSYFYNRMDEWVAHLNPDLWIYGHTHGNINFQLGDVPVVANQQGYLGETGTNKTFKPGSIYELKEDENE